jgi:predicted nucleotidyltransferase component of viral defense system
MHETIKSMLAKYACQTEQDTINALKEIFQEITLLGLWRAKFFEHAVFYGGTALRILHGLNRFSEDLDFSLIKPNANFQLNHYNQAIIQELQSFGFNVSIEKKQKPVETNIESAFIKANTHQQLIAIQSEKSIINRFHHMNNIKIKMEIDINPPQQFNIEAMTLFTPLPFSVNTMTMPDLFAGKIHAILCRPWQQRVKGRDWYDLIWYIGRETPVNLTHLKARLIQSNAWDEKEHLTHQALIGLLQTKINTTDFNNAKKDILPFIKDKMSVDLWNSAFFLEACKQLKTRIL